MYVCMWYRYALLPAHSKEKILYFLNISLRIRYRIVSITRFLPESWCTVALLHKPKTVTSKIHAIYERDKYKASHTLSPSNLIAYIFFLNYHVCEILIFDFCTYKFSLYWIIDKIIHLSNYKILTFYDKNIYSEMFCNRAAFYKVKPRIKMSSKNSLSKSSAGRANITHTDVLSIPPRGIFFLQ